MICCSFTIGDDKQKGIFAVLFLWTTRDILEPKSLFTLVGCLQHEQWTGEHFFLLVHCYGGDNVASNVYSTLSSSFVAWAQCSLWNFTISSVIAESKSIFDNLNTFKLSCWRALIDFKCFESLSFHVSSTCSFVYFLGGFIDHNLTQLHFCPFNNSRSAQKPFYVVILKEFPKYVPKKIKLRAYTRFFSQHQTSEIVVNWTLSRDKSDVNYLWFFSLTLFPQLSPYTQSHKNPSCVCVTISVTGASD